jgi:hypothetical protein
MKISTAVQQDCGYKDTLHARQYLAPLAKYFTVCVTCQLAFIDKIPKAHSTYFCAQQHWMYPVLSVACFVFSTQEHKQLALPISMHKHLSCAAFNIKRATGSGNAGTCEKLHDCS